MTIRPFRVVLGVTGSISAVKTQSLLISLLRKHGVDVRVAMTRSAQRFIGEAALRGVLECAPYLDLWSAPEHRGGETHVEWGLWADAVLVAPATASVLARLVAGQYDDPVTLVASMIEERRWCFAPGMAGEMWAKKATERNVQTLREWGASFFGPVVGSVASGRSGMRLMETEEIASALMLRLNELGLRASV